MALTTTIFPPFALLLLVLARIASCGFTSPGSGATWTVGERQRIHIENLVYENFTVALWQENEDGKGAKLGPAIFGACHKEEGRGLNIVLTGDRNHQRPDKLI